MGGAVSIKSILRNISPYFYDCYFQDNKAFGD
jgi:hypothetical protein